MRFSIVILLAGFVFASSSAFADGFRCEGQGFRVKIYNRVHPKKGTRNPAALIVSEDGRGTVAVVLPTDLKRENSTTQTTFEGETNGSIDGRFTFVRLTLTKKMKNDGTYEGTLNLNANHDAVTAALVCERYLKKES